jgi:type IV secretory pathway VirB2 component (pilin)
MSKFGPHATTTLVVRVFATVLLPAGTARAQSMPWETPLQNLQDSLTGPVARVFVMVAIVASGVGLAFGEGGNFWRKVCFVVFGASIVFGAASLVATFGG